KTLRSVLGRSHPDFQKLRVEKASKPDDDDDPNGPQPSPPVTPAPEPPQGRILRTPPRTARRGSETPPRGSESLRTPAFFRPTLPFPVRRVGGALRIPRFVHGIPRAVLARPRIGHRHPSRRSGEGSIQTSAGSMPSAEASMRAPDPSRRSGEGSIRTSAGSMRSAEGSMRAPGSLEAFRRGLDSNLGGLDAFRRAFRPKILANRPIRCGGATLRRNGKRCAHRGRTRATSFAILAGMSRKPLLNARRLAEEASALARDGRYRTELAEAVV